MLNSVEEWLMHIFGCQLDEPHGFPGDHQQNAAMFQCYVHFFVFTKFFLFLYHGCILSEIKLITTFDIITFNNQK